MLKDNTIIAITGNRDISNQQENFIKRNLEKLLIKLTNEIDNEIIILTPLADGVDRIIADIIIDSFNDIKILVPLPMSENIYKKTFGIGLTINTISHEESLKEYESLIYKIKKHNKSDDIYIDLKFNEEIYKLENEDKKREIRRNQYSVLGKFLVEKSDLLIAIYDDSKEKKKGGSIEVVENFKKINKRLIEIKVEKNV